MKTSVLLLIGLTCLDAFVNAQAAELPKEAPEILQLREDREEALQLKLDGKVEKDQKIVKVGNGRYVETALERTEPLLILLVEYEDLLHNQIPEPDRTIDWMAPWEPAYDRAHYEELVLGKMRRYFEAQSGGRYTIQGYVTDWLKLPAGGHYFTHPAAAIVAWIDAQVQVGRTYEEVVGFLRQFDTYDQFDFNQNGIFDEPDGVLDKVILVEAGGFNASKGAFGAAGDEDFRFPVTPVAIGATGLLVGSHFYADEAAPLGLYAHEYAHLLGLPDEYFRGPTDPGSPTGHWTLMSSHWILGDRPGLSGVLSMSAWDKLQLGWLNYEVTTPDKRGAFTLGAAAAPANTRKPQALVVNLPIETNPYSGAPTKPVSWDGLQTPIPSPVGYAHWWAGQPVGATATMVRKIRVPPSNPILTMKLWWQGFAHHLDYSYVEASTDGGATWTRLASPGLTTDANLHGFNEGNGLTGSSGSAPATWWAEAVVVSASFDLTPYAGADILLRIRHQKNHPNDSWTAELLHEYGGITLEEFLQSYGAASLEQVLNDATQFVGLIVDDLSLGDWTDAPESTDSAWVLDGFTVQSAKRPHYYIAEYRSHSGTDAALIDSFPASARGNPVQVDRFGYDPGLLVWYRNRTFRVHWTGRGIVAIDAHPAVDYYTSGHRVPNTIQLRDTAFSRVPTTGYAFYDYRDGSGPAIFPSLPPEPVFDDSRDYSSPYPFIGVSVPRTGTRIEVVATSMQETFMQIITGPR